MKLTDDIIKCFRIGKYFDKHTEQINSISYSDSGEWLISCSNDDSMNLYDCFEGKFKNTFFSKKYGCSSVSFTHSNNCIIHASTMINDSIKYLSLYDNKYLRYFNGHIKPVTRIVVSPVDDTFLSSSFDKTIRLWDLRSPNCQGMLCTNSEYPCCSIDPEGLIFASSVDGSAIKLYDIRSFDRGPFATFHVGSYNSFKSSMIVSFDFAPDGKSIFGLSITNDNNAVLFSIDSFQGHLNYYNVVSNNQNISNITSNIENDSKTRHKPPTFNFNAISTPDSNYIITMSKFVDLYNIWLFSLKEGKKLTEIDPQFQFKKSSSHLSDNCIVKFNPSYMMMSSVHGRYLALWQPNVDEIDT